MTHLTTHEYNITAFDTIGNIFLVDSFCINQVMSSTSILAKRNRLRFMTLCDFFCNFSFLVVGQVKKKHPTTFKH